MKVKGLEQLLKNFDKIGKNATKECQDIINKTALNVHATAVKKVQAPGKGRTYDTTFFIMGGRVIPGPLRTGQNLSPTHTASKPGDPPASDTGIGASSIKFRFGKLQADVWTDKDYMAWLEYGTRRVAPRPWLNPSLNENRKAFFDSLHGLVDRLYKGLN